jgi:hypothetical protein
MVRGKRGNKHTTAIFFSLSSGVMKNFAGEMIGEEKK